MLVDIANKLQYVIQNNFYAIIFSLPLQKGKICRVNAHLHNTVSIQIDA